MDCYNCRNSALESLPPRESIVRTQHWRVGHAFNVSLPGWLVIAPIQHVVALDELPADAHVELGTLLGSLSAALRSVTGCVKTYVMQFSEAEGFEHLHVHLVPRMADQPPDLKGPNVFGYLTDDEGDGVTAAERDRVAIALQGALG
ncbi:HIT family protein [Nocardioides panzhihuensis]|uniref:Diadenosine tetraphosphate (Ap4A) HIT family hydrolase n=1 Tax=Nocardioides panzhihuensis TaxID=860243 RepID=A0A7Z0DQN0_9ACTN|nr:HIT family protein [Nocardioides panzhihuensis]NYI80020.1 diadenosine tetraphosphate (Ap4A) HIT family hydrolase [Nocardioides panzhihuensis]